jgi:ATP-dependent DNA helicase RecQ
VVTAVYYAACNRCELDGALALDAAGLASAAKGKVSDREAESALRLLTRAGAVSVSEGSRSRARVRMLATPARIRSELGSDETLEVGVLRALWRSTRGAIADGAIVDLDALPPGLTGSGGAAEVLDALQARQFVTWSRVGEGLVVTDRAAPIERWPIDWETLDRRRRAEASQLEVMQKYAYTDRCRRGFVLRYFGDPAATNRCEQCDNCLALKHQAVASVAPAKDLRKRASVGGGADKKGKSPPPELADLSDGQRALLDALRALRTSIARRESVPAYVVFADRTLREMARSRPATPGALADVFGVGPAKMEKYGEEFLSAIRLY